MWQRFLIWVRRRELRKAANDAERFAEMKLFVNAPCTSPCPDPICQQIGCLNQDGFALRHRIKLLLNRLDKVKMRKSDYESEGVEIPVKVIKTPPPDNVVDIKDFKKDE